MNRAFVVGAPKCGTTSIDAFFRQHRSVCCPTRKELHYFTRNEVAAGYYGPRVPDNEDAYEAQFRCRDEHLLRVEVSPSYLISDQALAAISSLDNCSGVLVMIREPIQRAVAHYLMDFQKGFVRAGLDEVLSDSARFPQHYREYIENSRYPERISAYVSALGPQRVRVVAFESFITNTQGTVNSLCEFFGLPHFTLTSPIEKNSYKAARWPLAKMARQSRLAYAAYSSLPSVLRDAAAAMFLRAEQKPDYSSTYPLIRGKLGFSYKELLTDLSSQGLLVIPEAEPSETSHQCQSRSDVGTSLETPRDA